MVSSQLGHCLTLSEVLRVRESWCATKDPILKYGANLKNNPIIFTLKNEFSLNRIKFAEFAEIFLIFSRFRSPLSRFRFPVSGFRFPIIPLNHFTTLPLDHCSTLVRVAEYEVHMLRVSPTVINI